MSAIKRFSILVCAISACGWSQIITSSIVGVVTDASGGVVPEAEITVVNTGTGNAVKTVADSSGAYSVPNLQFGVYDVVRDKTRIPDLPYHAAFKCRPRNPCASTCISRWEKRNRASP